MLYVLGNPNSGDKTTQQKIQEIETKFPHLEMKVFLTQAKDQEKELVDKILESYQEKSDQFLIIGGDGTLSKVLRYWPASYPFAYLQSGSGNDFGKGYPLPSMQGLIKAIESQSIAEITVLHSDEFVVVNSLGAGFDAHVIEQSGRTVWKNYFNKVHLGRFLYPALGLISMFSRKKVNLTLTDEKGKEHSFDNLFLFVLANNRYFGGGIEIWPEATVETAQIDLVYAPYRSVIGNMICLLQLLLHRQKKSRLIKHHVFHKLTLEFPREEGVQIDGEFVTIKEIELQPQVRKIYR